MLDKSTTKRQGKSMKITLLCVLLAVAFTLPCFGAFVYKTNNATIDQGDAEAFANYNCFNWDLSAWDDNYLIWNFDVPVSNAAFRMLGSRDRKVYLDIATSNLIDTVYHFTVTTNTESFSVTRPAVTYSNFYGAQAVTTRYVNVTLDFYSNVTASVEASNVSFVSAASNVVVSYLSASTTTYTATSGVTTVPAWGVFTSEWYAVTNGTASVSNRTRTAGVTGTNIAPSSYTILSNAAYNTNTLVYSARNSGPLAESSFILAGANSATGVASFTAIDHTLESSGSVYLVSTGLRTFTVSFSYNQIPLSGAYLSGSGLYPQTRRFWVDVSDGVTAQGGNVVDGVVYFGGQAGAVSYVFATTSSVVNIRFRATEVYHGTTGYTNWTVAISNVAVVRHSPITNASIFSSSIPVTTGRPYQVAYTIGASASGIGSTSVVSFFGTTLTNAGNGDFRSTALAQNSDGMTITFGAPSYYSATTQSVTLSDITIAEIATNTTTVITTNPATVTAYSNMIVSRYPAYDRTNSLWSITTAEVWRTTAFVSRSNLPPVQPYLAEVLSYETTATNEPTRTVAKGKINVLYSLYQETNWIGWTNPIAGAMIGPPVHTLTDPYGWPFVVGSSTNDPSQWAQWPAAFNLNMAENDITNVDNIVANTLSWNGGQSSNVMLLKGSQTLVGDLVVTGKLVAGTGTGNSATSLYSVVLGGESNVVSAIYSAIVGGWYNKIHQGNSSIIGGRGNIIQASSSSAAGGATIGGGEQNRLVDGESAIAGGYGNTGGYACAISGGLMNYTTGRASSVSGGLFNRGHGDFSWIGGRQGVATSYGSFVWSCPISEWPSDAMDVWVEGEQYGDHGRNTFNIRATGGFYHNDGTNEFKIDNGVVTMNGRFVDDTNKVNKAGDTIWGPTAITASYTNDKLFRIIPSDELGSEFNVFIRTNGQTLSTITIEMQNQTAATLLEQNTSGYFNVVNSDGFTWNDRMILQQDGSAALLTNAEYTLFSATNAPTDTLIIPAYNTNDGTWGFAAAGAGSGATGSIISLTFGGSNYTAGTPSLQIVGGGVSTGYDGSAATFTFPVAATGTPLYAYTETDTQAIARLNIASNGLQSQVTTAQATGVAAHARADVAYTAASAPNGAAVTNIPASWITATNMYLGTINTNATTTNYYWYVLVGTNKYGHVIPVAP